MIKIRENTSRDTTGFWEARCAPFTKELMLIGLVMAFLAQTVLVYADIHGTVKIDGAQLAGRRLWHQHNCQSCHQLHGYGGFLGPDLTNATARLTQDQFHSQLSAGNAQMPAFNLPPGEVDSVWAFLQAMNETGTGQARNPNLKIGDDSGGASMTNTPALDRAITRAVAESGDTTIADGMTLFQTRACTACHTLFARSAVGAPDLSRSGTRLSPGELEAVLRDGRPPKMPKPSLAPIEQERVLAFVLFIAEHRSQIVDHPVAEPGSFWSALPWWEYE